MEILESWGFEVVAGPILARRLAGAGGSELNFLAASDEERLEELVWALSSPEVDGCWVVRGGHGMTRLVGDLPALVERPVFGFSDVTALLATLQHRLWSQLVHCANVQSLPVLDAASLEATRRLVKSGRLNPLPGTWLRPGRAEGVLWGGNLCVLTCLCGTSEASSEGGILALEDVNEAPYRLDRMLVQLEACGAFYGLAGVALGEFVECGDLDALWRHWAQRWQVPILTGLPFGHGAGNHPLALGRRVVLDQSQMSWVDRSIFSGIGAGPASSGLSG
jgi:muramoyltetrapeptide carboxypeptidase